MWQLIIMSFISTHLKYIFHRVTDWKIIVTRRWKEIKFHTGHILIFRECSNWQSLHTILIAMKCTPHSYQVRVKLMTQTSPWHSILCNTGLYRRPFLLQAISIRPYLEQSQRITFCTPGMTIQRNKIHAAAIVLNSLEAVHMTCIV